MLLTERPVGSTRAPEQKPTNTREELKEKFPNPRSIYLRNIIISLLPTKAMPAGKVEDHSLFDDRLQKAIAVVPYSGAPYDTSSPQYLEWVKDVIFVFLQDNIQNPDLYSRALFYKLSVEDAPKIAKLREEHGFSMDKEKEILI